MSNISNVITFNISHDSTSFDDKWTKSIVLNSFLREYPLYRNGNSMTMLSFQELSELCAVINNPPRLVLREAMVEGIIIGFMTNLTLIRNFFSNCFKKYFTSSPREIERKTRIYLHKIHRLAPIFNYKRAVVNSNFFLKLCSRESFSPLVSTQLAMVIYITDELDARVPKKLMQKNIQYICSCSAYAFHHAKNLLDIDRLIGKKV